MNNKFLTAGRRYIGDVYSKMSSLERLAFCSDGAIPQRFNDYIENINKVKGVSCGR